MPMTPLFLTILYHVLSLVNSCDIAELSNCTCSGTQVLCNSLGFTVVPNNIHNTTTVLQLSGNELTSIDDNSFNGLTLMTDLRMTYNKISSISVNAFIHMPMLTIIYLDSNLLTLLPSGLFTSNTRLQRIYIKNNQLSKIDGSLVRHLTSLTVLQASPTNSLKCCNMADFLAWTNTTTAIVTADCTDTTPTVGYKFFNSSVCAVDGHWGSWTSLSCSVTCGDGIVTRTRNCDSPAPSYGGSNCVGSSNETMFCNLGNCIVSSSTTATSSISSTTVLSFTTVSSATTVSIATTDSSDKSEIKSLIIGLVFGVSGLVGIIALVSILLTKYTSPRVRHYGNKNSKNNNNDIIKEGNIKKSEKSTHCCVVKVM